MITYTADSHVLYGSLVLRPAADHPPGAMRKVFEWDTGKYLGEIKQVAHTFRVVGNMNEHQVVIGETTFGGRKELRHSGSGIDYGTLIWVALERARTARDAIRIMTELVAEYGYYSEGETFSIADPQEVWMMDMIGKGPGKKGALWVARRIPDGFVSAHANQPRIRQFPRNDPERCLYAPDVVSFAREKGYFSGKDEEFAFADAYAPPSCRDLRVREARVWSFFRRVAGSQKISSDYAACKPGAKPMPLWVKPDQLLSPRDIITHMRDHFEDTIFDLRKGVGAGPFGLPYRWRPLTWVIDGNKYVNERATATQQTGFSFVSQSRAWLPAPIGGVLWFSVDDTASTVFVPIYSGITKAPKPYAADTASFTEFSWDSAFWVFNWVANFAYSRYQDIIKDIEKVQGELEGGLFDAQADLESRALAVYKKSPAKVEPLLTKYAHDTSEKVLARWRRLGEQLLMKYLDGNVRDKTGKVTHPGYPEHWYRRIVDERGDHFLIAKTDQKKDGGSAEVARSASVPAPRSAPGRNGGCHIGCGNAYAVPGCGLLLLLWLGRQRRR